LLGGDETGRDPSAEELIELAREIRERVRSRHPTHTAQAIALPDLMPLLHARDAAEGKVAAIGTVNPRPPGVLNALIQRAKSLIARLLDWHVREQVEFNRSVVRALNAILEALNENNRALARIGEAASAGRDVAVHWAQWRPAWEQRLDRHEIQTLRTIAELRGLLEQRTAQLESGFRDLVRAQHEDFRASLAQSVVEIQKRLASDLEKTRIEFERLIHAELRLIRQRAALEPSPAPRQPPPTAEAPAGSDPLSFALRFRGSEEEVRRRQRFYVPYFQARQAVVDLGCGRGEFLELMREAGVPARGVDRDTECVRLCRAKGLEAEQGDLLDWLRQLPEGSLDGIFCSHVLEHLPPQAALELIRLAASKLERGGLFAVETPNPECLATLAAFFYLDPTHVRPVPAPLLRFYLEETGFGGVEMHLLSPAEELYPALTALPEGFRQAFFGGMDYAMLARKL
jgi:O-antigen chain-terminating methyltransferase